MNSAHIRKYAAVFVLAFLLTVVILIASLPSGNDISGDDILDDVHDDNQIHIITPPNEDQQYQGGREDDFEEQEPEREEEPERESPIIEKVELNDEPMPENLAAIAEKYNVIGMSLVVIKNGEVDKSYVYGYRDRENQIAFSSSTVMRTAAVSEMVSAVGVMKLCESGELNLDLPIDDFLGYSAMNPKVKKTITLRQILTHTAGISDYGAYNRVVNNDLSYQTLKNMLNGEYASSNFFEMNPGYKYEFSNFGAAMIAPIVSSVTNESFDDYMSQILFDKLCLDAAYSSAGIEGKAKIASIYRQNTLNYTPEQMDAFAAELMQIDPIDNYRISHGNLFISAADLSRIARMFLGYGEVDGVRILERESVEDMIKTSARGSLYADVSAGLGMTVNTKIVPGRTLYGHQGGAYGGTVEVFFDFSDNSGVIIVTNGSLNTTDDEDFSLMGKAFIQEIYKDN